jgi:hypothetical protein
VIDTNLTRDASVGRTATRRRFWVVLLVVLVAAAGIRAFDVKPAAAQTQTLTAWRSTVDPGFDPQSAAWDSVPPAYVQLTGQNVTPPMSTGGAPWIRVAVLHFEDVLYVNLQWVDQTLDSETDAVGVFSDAVAVQFPAIAASSVPALCMGQADTAVNIWHWRADTQWSVALTPAKGYVDAYPEADELHYPAIAAGNPMATASAVQNLVAGGFGTLASLEEQVIAGEGAHDEMGWSVTMARPFAPPGELQPTFSVGVTMDVAFAVWNGDHDDRNGQKSVSAFTRLVIDHNAYVPVGPGSGATSSSATIVLLFVGMVVAAVIFGFAVTRGSAEGEPEVPAS